MPPTKTSQLQSHKNTIRREMRSKRRSLTHKQQILAAHGLVRHARTYAHIMKAKRVLAYQASAGEISADILLKAMKVNNLYSPKITHYQSCLMQFYPSGKMDSYNRYGILEPSAVGEPAKAAQFDVIFLPLVAFDRNGARLGMGSGYYDRALSCLAHQASTRPKLVGLAHHFQEVANLQSEPWDICLNVILTDHELINIDV